MALIPRDSLDSEYWEGYRLGDQNGHERGYADGVNRILDALAELDSTSPYYAQNIQRFIRGWRASVAPYEEGQRP